MGWKNLKEHYRISHIVQVTKEGICIGSLYIHNLMVIGTNGEILKRNNENRSKELVRYQAEMDADPSKLRELIEAPDSFTGSVVVYTYKNGDIIEKLCEEPGWPNMTHDGDRMYANTYMDKEFSINPRYQNGRYHDCRFCAGTGCLVCVGEAQKAVDAGLLDTNYCPPSPPTFDEIFQALFGPYFDAWQAEQKALPEHKKGRPRYDEKTRVYRDCPLCDGEGCEFCPEEAEKEYRRQFPDAARSALIYEFPRLD